MLSLDVDSELAQETLGRHLAEALPDTGVVIYMQGDLGTGKTTLARGILRGLDYTGSVKSPTYTLIEPYHTQYRTVLHLDLYRLNSPMELEYLGCEDLAEPKAIWLVEWPERGMDWLLPPDLLIAIAYKTMGRRLTLTPKTSTGTAILTTFQEY